MKNQLLEQGIFRGMNKKLHLFFNLKLLFTFLADLITVLKYGIIGGLQFFQAVFIQET